METQLFQFKLVKRLYFPPRVGGVHLILDLLFKRDLDP